MECTTQASARAQITNYLYRPTWHTDRPRADSKGWNVDL